MSETAEEFAKRFWHDIAARKDLKDYGAELILERDASIRAPLETVLEAIRTDPKTYHRWTTNNFDGEREMVGCNYCPASAEGQIPINHHRMCVLSPDREQAFEEERAKRGWAASDELMERIDRDGLAAIPDDELEPVSDEMRDRALKVVKEALQP